ncbi:MAG TPA: AcvB/VirJ family lysyl-phosphatidylglycerol hydrolase [Candidatus Competibacteraceae bacterium]|nr:AcvB/VirJ family lysyl-phosphatidylglycerol hydrolase [Candidatus Competibacteraceae bacterium]HSA45762.1 AcvB/VirJ family lysyl-phosphatidylglycerol hydrolase [Candidatus Competibacteraceae bacterium]
MIMHKFSQVLGLSAALLTMFTVQAEIVEETLDHPTFGQLAIYRTADEPKGIVLFPSGVDGWSPELATAAREIADLDYVVAGMDLHAYLAYLHRSTAACIDVSTDFDQLNQFMEQRYSPATHRPPILLGYGAGAALGYAALIQAPVDHFHAGVGVNFCPELPLHKPLCPGVGKLESATGPDSPGTLLKPAPQMPTTWFVFQNQTPCDSAAPFVKSIPLARLTDIPGEAGVKTWLPQVSALLQWLDPSIVRQVQPNASVSRVPLIEVPTTGGPERSQLAVMLSGDGGWAVLDRAVTAELAKNGLPTVGWDSLSYFWKARQPEEVALDLERVLRHYLDAWKKERFVLIGYSFGANVLPAVIHRLPSDLRDRIDLAVFLGLSDYASFEFHLTDWINDSPDEGDQPIRPELVKLSGMKRLCLYGADEEDSSCPKVTELGVIVEKMPGDHHFDEDYPGVARRILEQLPPLPPSPAPKG